MKQLKIRARSAKPKEGKPSSSSARLAWSIAKRHVRLVNDNDDGMLMILMLLLMMIMIMMIIIL